MYKKKNIFSLIFGIILVIGLISLTSANGIKVSPTNLSINKTNGIDSQVQLTISNEEPFDFNNIGFNQESIITMDKINLTSGQNATVTATIKTNNDFNGVLKLIGYYETTIGASNQTYDVKILYSQGFDICNLDLVKGDKINWKNQHTDQIELKNTDNGEIITTIPAGGTHLRTFTEPISFSYVATWLTLPFTQVCHINVQDDTGLVHSQGYDFNLNANIKVIFEPTTISTTFLTTNYTINYNANTDDIFQIKNTGTKIAKNIHLSGNWITFNENNLNLNPGEQKNIGYTIQPQIFETNGTNKTYNLELKIEGNFETKIQNISVFVPYAIITNQFNNGTFDPDFMRNLYNFYCNQKPEDTICANVYSNGTNQGTSIIFTSEFVQALFEKTVSLLNNFDSLSKNQLEFQINQSLIDQNQNEILSNITNEQIKSRESQENLSSIILFVIIIFIFMIFCVLMIWLFFKDKGLIKSKLRFHKGELPY